MMKKQKLSVILAVMVALVNVVSYAQEQTAPETLEVLKNFPVAFFLGSDKDLVTSLSQSSSGRYYLYGGSQTAEYSYPLPEGGKLNPVLSYFLVLASLGETQIKVEYFLRRGASTVPLGGEEFKVSSAQYGSYMGFIAPKNEKTQSGDIFVLRITGAGSDFGIQFGPNGSMITFLKPDAGIAGDVLNERSKLLAWIIQNNTYGVKAAIVYNMYRNIDFLILNNKDGEWKVGSKMTKAGEFYSLEWKSNKFTASVISKDKAKELDIGEYSMKFIH
jgi:hypothetical protein